MMMIPRDMRQRINRFTHEEGLRHALAEKERLIAGVEQLMREGKAYGEIQEWLAGRLAGGRGGIIAAED